jgi:hypothetical protein
MEDWAVANNMTVNKSWQLPTNFPSFCIVTETRVWFKKRPAPFNKEWQYDPAPELCQFIINHNNFIYSPFYIITSWIIKKKLVTF